jgi:YgiT-type zinc finger domain-containing protein
MNCVVCKHGEPRAALVTVTLQRGDTIVILKQVPAEACQNCGEYYLSDTVAGQVMNRAEAAVKSGAEVEILRFAA